MFTIHLKVYNNAETKPDFKGLGPGPGLNIMRLRLITNPAYSKTLISY